MKVKICAGSKKMLSISFNSYSGNHSPFSHKSRCSFSRFKYISHVEGPQQLKDHRHWGDGSLADVILRRRAIPIVPESESNGWGVSEVEAILGSASRFPPESRRPGKVRSCWGSSTIALSYHAWAFNRECFDNLNQPSLWMSFALCHRPCAILSSKPYDKVYFFIISCIDRNWILAISHICDSYFCICLLVECLVWSPQPVWS